MGYTISHEEAIKKTAEIVGFETPLSRWSEFLNRKHIDFELFAKGLENLFPDWDYYNRKYHGMSCSLEEFIVAKYGEDNMKIIKQALMVDDPDNEKIIRDAASRAATKLGTGLMVFVGEFAKVQKWLDLTFELDKILGFDVPMDAEKTKEAIDQAST